MKTNRLNSSEGLKGFSETFSIFSLMRKNGKTAKPFRTLQSPPENDELKSNFPAYNLASKTTLAVCEGCNRLDVIQIGGESVAGCLYIAQGQYFDGWRRLPDDVEECLWRQP